MLMKSLTEKVNLGLSFKKNYDTGKLRLNLKD
jgi:hypothetical protein